MINLNDQAAAELQAAVNAIHADDEQAGKLASDFRRAIDTVNSASKQAVAMYGRLHADDVMNPAGKERQLQAIPRDLVNATAVHLDEAELNLDRIEGQHRTAILRHDDRKDTSLLAEMSNYLANVRPEDAVATLIRLASNPRYSTFLAGPFGESLGERFGFDHAILRAVALDALAVNGSPAQVRRSAALTALDAGRRVVQLARAGRDNVVQEVQKPPRPSPSEAMM